MSRPSEYVITNRTSHISANHFWAHHLILCGSLPFNTDDVGSKLSHPLYSGMTCYTSNALVDFLFSTELLLLVAKCMGDCSSPYGYTQSSRLYK